VLFLQHRKSMLKSFSGFMGSSLNGKSPTPTVIPSVHPISMPILGANVLLTSRFLPKSRGLPRIPAITRLF